MEKGQFERFKDIDFDTEYSVLADVEDFHASEVGIVEEKNEAGKWNEGLSEQEVEDIFLRRFVDTHPREELTLAEVFELMNDDPFLRKNKDGHFKEDNMDRQVPEVFTLEFLKNQVKKGYLFFDEDQETFILNYTNENILMMMN